MSAADRQLFQRTRWYLLLDVLYTLWLYLLIDRGEWLMLAVFSILYVAQLWRFAKRAAGLDTSPPPPNPEDLDPRSAFWLDPATALHRMSGRVKRRVSA